MKRGGAVLALVVAAGATALVARGDDSRETVEPTLPVERVAERVERIRGLRFERLPSVAFLRRRDLAREASAPPEPTPQAGPGPPAETPPEHFRAAALALGLAGVWDARELQEPPPLTGFATARRVVVSYELLERDPAEAEAVLAHELAHALEFQRFTVDDELLPLVDEDRAREALIEGSAMLVESEYRIRHQGVRADPDAYARRLARSARGEVRGNAALTAYWNLPYSAGTRYVTALRRDGGWKAVDRALRRPPATTAEVLHPGAPRQRGGTPRYSPVTALDPSRLAILSILNAGEMDTRVIAQVGVGASRARRAAAGTVDGHVEVYDVYDTARECEAPCRRHAAAVFSWRARDRRAARRLADTLRDGLVNAFGARRAGRAMVVADWGAAVDVDGTAVQYAFAPSPRLARRLVGR